MSLFGESATDQRDFRLGLAGLLAGIHSLRILAERGIATFEDIRISRQGIDEVLQEIPDHAFVAESRQGIIEMLDKIAATAAVNEK